ncbi:Ephrin type-A receptor 2, partial [Apostichopus japonicus]
PYYIYQELLEYGTLREILMRIGNSQHHLQNPSNGKEELTNAACLVGFARDVASGLEFLHINKLCHPGLMTRKILYDSNNKCKLFDFWPNEISSDRLKKILTRKDPPIGWFPPETIFMNQYDEVSDIWSYGVILWEIFSFGEEPYQHESVKDVEENIRQLNLLPRPMSCPGSIFSIMLSAWTQTRETRPSISELKTKMDDISAEYLPIDRAPPSTDYFSISDPNAEYAVPWANI